MKSSKSSSVAWLAQFAVTVIICVIMAGFSATASSAALFPIATGGAAQSYSFDGTNYLVGIENHQTISQATPTPSIAAQLISSGGSKVGSLISTGRTGIATNVAFDGTNYLLIWEDDGLNTFNGNTGWQIYGQFISTAGATVGQPFAISSMGVWFDGVKTMAFGGGKYLVTYTKLINPALGDQQNNRNIFGRIVDPGGAMGSEFQISSGFGAGSDIAFDGANFFVVWREDFSDQEIRGRFVSPAGVLGTEISVNASPAPSDNPISVAFDGTNYLVVWNDETGGAGTGTWDVFGQRVNTSGSLVGGVITITNEPGMQMVTSVAFDGVNYLAVWMDMQNPANWDMYGRYISKSGALIGSKIIISTDATNQMGGVGFANGKYLALVNSGVTMGQGGITAVDSANGLFLTPIITASTQFTASGTYNFNSGTGLLSFNWASSDFVCDGPSLGPKNETVTLPLTATTMAWAGSTDNPTGMTWTRNNGTAGDILGAWTSTDITTGNIYTITFNADLSVSVTATIIQCSDGGGGGGPTEPMAQFVNNSGTPLYQISVANVAFAGNAVGSSGGSTTYLTVPTGTNPIQLQETSNSSPVSLGSLGAFVTGTSYAVNIRNVGGYCAELWQMPDTSTPFNNNSAKQIISSTCQSPGAHSIIVMSHSGTMAAAVGSAGTPDNTTLNRLDTANTTGLNFVPAAVGPYGTFTQAPAGAPVGTPLVINIPPAPLNNIGNNGYFKTTFILPTGFTNAQLAGKANIDDKGRAFLNGNPISNSILSTNYISNSGDIPFSTSNQAFFRAGENELLFSDANTGDGPSGGAFYAVITYDGGAAAQPPTITNFTPTSGAPGTQIVINGTNFDPNPGNNTVKFNGVNAQVLSSTGTQLTVTAPPNGTTGPVSVTIGASTATGGTFTYNSTGHTISGKVTNASSAGVQNVYVTAFMAGGGGLLYGGGASTDASGNYTINGLPAGSYKLQFITPTNYDNVWYSGRHDSMTADTIVLNGTNSAVANQVLTSGATATVSGKVTDSNGIGIFNVGVSANDAISGALIFGTVTDPAGNYSINGFASGSYRVFFNGGNAAGNYQRGWYNGTPTPVNPASTYSITINAPTGVSNINVTLAQAGAISGTVSNSSATGIENVTVYAWDYYSNSYSAQTNTAADGTYTLKGLSNGTYKVFVDGSAKGYNRLFYNTQSATIFPGAASAIPVTTPNTTSGKNVTLASAGTITGTVTNAAGAGLASILVTPYDAITGQIMTNAPVTTDGQGKYIISGLGAGSYKLLFGGGTWATMYYGGSIYFSTATEVPVTAGSATITNMTLTPGSSISGRVANSLNQGVSGISVAIHYSSGSYITSVSTDANGNYIFNGVPSGTYKLRFNNGNGNGKWLARRTNGGFTDFNHAPPITVNNPAPVVGIDAMLPPAGAISGKAADASNAEVYGVVVVPYYANTLTQVWSMNASTDAGGNYFIGGLDPGNYKIQFNGSETLQGNYYNTKADITASDQVTVTAGATTGNINSVLTVPAAPVTIYKAGILHKIVQDGTEYDAFDVSLNSFATTLAGLHLTVTGPANFSYTFINSDRIVDSNHRLLLYKAYQTNGATPSPQAPGVYTFTLTDTLGNVLSSVTDTHVTVAAPLPIVNSTTIKYTRNGDGTYHFTWTPVAGNYFYRITLALKDGFNSTIFQSDRSANAFADVPAGKMIEGLAYKVRVETFDASVYENVTNRSDSEYVDAGAVPASITFTGNVTTIDNSNVQQPLAGATIEMVGSPLLSATSNNNGDFTLSGLPVGQPFSLKISKIGDPALMPTYTNTYITTANIASQAPYILFTSTQLSNSFGPTTSGKGVIFNRLPDNLANSSDFLVGGIIKATSALHPATPYTVLYSDGQNSGGSGTMANGKYFINNIDDGDTVTVTASKPGWSFPTRSFLVHANSVSKGRLYGNQVAPGDFPISSTTGHEMAIGAAFDGINYLVGIQGDAQAANNVSAQLVSTTGALVGNRISIGRTGGHPEVAFDGTNFLMIWGDDATAPNDIVYGQLISRAGTKVGAPFAISQTGGRNKPGSRNLLFDGRNYFVAWESRTTPDSGDTADIYGQFVTPAGSLLGAAIPVSTATHGQRDAAVSFDGTNILVAWADGRSQSACTASQCYESDIYGQFVAQSTGTTAGTLTGINFPISQSVLPHDNPIGLAYDGTNYLVTFHEQTTLPDACPSGICEWNVYAQRVSRGGAAVGARITISNAAGNQHFPIPYFDGTQYLITWTNGLATPGSRVSTKGRFLNPASGTFSSPEFTLFADTTDGRVPWAAVPAGFIKGKYLVLANWGKPGNDPMNFDAFSSADVYGALIGNNSLVTGASSSISPAPLAFGTVDVGSSASQTVTVTNNGPGSMTVFSNYFSGDTSQFTFSAAPGTLCPSIPFTMAPGSCTFAVTFAPTSVGPKTAYLTYNTDTANAPVYVLTLGGTGNIPAGDNTPPLVTGLSLPQTSKTFTVAVTNFTATDDTGVTGFCLKENINPAGCAWQGAAPVSYTFSGTDGLKTLYGFARDAAGNISMPLVSQVIIDTTAPIIPLDPVVRFITDSSAQVQWQTNEPARGNVVYGTTNPPASTVSESAYALAHGVTLTGLSAATTYYLKVTASDALNNGPTESFVVSFTTKQAPDITPPVITAGPAVVSIGSNTATVVWKTDEPSTGAVSGSFGATINDPAGLTVNHSVTLGSLSASTTYTIQVSATDAVGNGPTTSPVISFKTAAVINSDTTPPVIIQGPQALGVTDSSANIVWATDEASDGSVSYSDGVSTLVARDPAFGNVHNVVLSGLKQATQYSFTVSSSDRVPNGPTTSLARNFTTKATPDVTPPAFMSGPNAVFIDTQRALVIWDTDEQSDSLVEYGLASNSLDRAAAAADLVTRHGIQLSNLAINTPYFYRVRSRDVAGNEAVSLTKSFTTKNVVQIVPLLLTQQPAIDFNTGTMARVTWKTNKPADTRVIYGDTSGANLVELSLMDKTTDHVMILPNLLPGTPYTVLYSSTDMDNLNVSGYVGGGGGAATAKVVFSKATLSKPAYSNTGTTSFTTPAATDTTPPVITAGPSVTSTGDTTATIQWTTNEIADSQVSCTQDGQSSPLTFGDVAQALSHSLVLTRLTPNTTYTCQVASTDPLGNGPTTSSPFSFTTAAVADTTPPALTAAPTLTLKGNGLAALSWKTDKAAASVVRYGAPAALNDLLTTDGTGTDHSLNLALTAGTLYNYTVELTDPSNNKSTTSPLVLSLKYGDCDNTGTVSIAEVQGSINMFLGLKTSQICVDYDAAGSVSISKVQKAINSFLGP